MPRASDVTSRDAVLAAIAEFDEIGREAFLASMASARLASTSWSRTAGSTTQKLCWGRRTATSSMAEPPVQDFSWWRRDPPRP